MAADKESLVKGVHHCGVKWCTNMLGNIMSSTTKQSPQLKHEAKTTRASISFPCELYETIEQLAKEKKVSVAWIVREATEKYVGEQWPLLEKSK